MALERRWFQILVLSRNKIFQKATTPWILCVSFPPPCLPGNNKLWNWKGTMRWGRKPQSMGKTQGELLAAGVTWENFMEEYKKKLGATRKCRRHQQRCCNPKQGLESSVAFPAWISHPAGKALAAPPGGQPNRWGWNSRDFNSSTALPTQGISFLGNGGVTHTNIQKNKK